MALSLWIIFLFILKGVKSSEEGIDSNQCNVELVDEETLKYRILCDSKTTHKLCYIEEMCWNNRQATYGLSESLDLFEGYGLAIFEFDEDGNRTEDSDSLRNCNMNITVVGNISKVLNTFSVKTINCLNQSNTYCTQIQQNL